MKGYGNSLLHAGTTIFGGEKNLSPKTPSSLSCHPGGDEVSPPPDPYLSVPKDKKNKFQTMGNVFPSIAPPVKIRIPKEFCKKSFERGSGNDCPVPKLLSLDKFGIGPEVMKKLNQRKIRWIISRILKENGNSQGRMDYSNPREKLNSGLHRCFLHIISVQISPGFSPLLYSPCQL